MAELIMLKFDDTYGAQQAMSAVRALEELRYAWVDDVAIVERHHSGRIGTHTTHGSVSEGALWGGLTGMLVGILFPPVGFLGFWLAGSAIGGVAEALTKKHGLDKEMLDEIKNSLDKGTSALLLIGLEGDVDEMARAFEPYQPTQVIRRALADETVDGLKDTLTEAEQAEQADQA
ncbi:MAG: DUF1269 domain-containing protein [Acidimicrobiales bacterium]|jgi:uncharacterized membrane protein|nr:DUF1269 domain-containing protein [Acidimicrobiales bacterium]